MFVNISEINSFRQIQFSNLFNTRRCNMYDLFMATKTEKKNTEKQIDKLDQIPTH